MSVQGEIDRIKGNVAAAYAAVSAKGGVLPETQNSENLSEAIESIPTSGGGSSMEVYDDQERVIGTWFGKPMYRKTFPFHQTRTSNYTSMYTLVGTIDNANILRMYGRIWSHSNNYKYPIPSSEYVKSSSETYNYSFQALNNVASGGIYVSSYIWRGEFDGYLTVEYTKTTD